MSFGMPPPARTLTTGDGDVVGYYEFGDPDGTPVVAFHGTPASGAGFVWADDAARARGLRIVAPDRPGIGASARAKLHVVADYVPVLRATVDALGIEQFDVLGYSGGGPYALAVAHELPERVRAAAIVAGAGQVGEWANTREFESTDRQMTWLSLHAPLAARMLVSSSARLARLVPPVSIRFAQLEMTRRDRAVLERFATPAAALALFTRAVDHSAAGVVDDYAALGRPWGFAVDDIRVPVMCWHGTDDRMVPYQHSEALVARIDGAQLVMLPGEGHLAIVEHIAEILDWLSVGRPDHSAR